MARFNNDQISAGIWLLSGAVIAGVSIIYGIGTRAAPGSGFITLLAGLGISLFSLIGLVEASLRKGGERSWHPVFKGVDWKKAFVVLGSLAAYAFLLNPLGFLPCTALFLAFMLRWVKPQPWSVVITGSILAALGAYVIFEIWLQAQLPKGLLGF